jgi:hypothetical protein
MRVSLNHFQRTDLGLNFDHSTHKNEAVLASDLCGELGLRIENHPSKKNAWQRR